MMNNFFFAQLFVTIEMNFENAIKGKEYNNSVNNLDLVFIFYFSFFFEIKFL